MSLREPEVTVKAVQQDLERILQCLEVMLLRGIFLSPHFRLRFQAKRAEVSEQMPEDLQLVGCREAIELQHDRRIERCDVAMPDVAGHAGEEDVGVTTLECARHRQLGNGMTLPEIFTQEERVDARGVAAHDHVLVVVWENLRLDEVARTQQLR